MLHDLIDELYLLRIVGARRCSRDTVHCGRLQCIVGDYWPRLGSVCVQSYE